MPFLRSGFAFLTSQHWHALRHWANNHPFRLTKALDQLITRWRVIERYQLLGEINRNDITSNYYQSLSIGLFLTGVTLGDRFYFSSLSAESHSLVPWTHWIRAKTPHRIPRNRIHQALLHWMSLREKTKGWPRSFTVRFDRTNRFWSHFMG